MITPGRPSDSEFTSLVADDIFAVRSLNLEAASILRIKKSASVFSEESKLHILALIWETGENEARQRNSPFAVLASTVSPDSAPLGSFWTAPEKIHGWRLAKLFSLPSFITSVFIISSLILNEREPPAGRFFEKKLRKKLYFYKIIPFSCIEDSVSAPRPDTIQLITSLLDLPYSRIRAGSKPPET